MSEGQSEGRLARRDHSPRHHVPQEDQQQIGVEERADVRLHDPDDLGNGLPRSIGTIGSQGVENVGQLHDAAGQIETACIYYAFYIGRGNGTGNDGWCGCTAKC